MDFPGGSSGGPACYCPDCAVGCSSGDQCQSDHAYESIAQSAAYMEEALRFMRKVCASQPVCSIERPKHFPGIIPSVKPCRRVSYPAGCCSFPNRTRTSVAPEMAPCPVCLLEEVQQDPPARISTHRAIASGRMLLRAAYYGRTKVIRKLVRAGADVNFAGAGRWTALHKAAERSEARAIWWLLRLGADVDARNCGGYTALHIASSNDCCGVCVSILICAGADLNCRNESGQTPMHIASQCANDVAVRALVAAGAKKYIVNNQGRTPFHVAAEKSTRRILVCRGLHPVSLY